MPHVAALLSGAAAADVRYHALRTFNMLATLMPAWLRANLEGYVSGLLALASAEHDSRILKEVCIGANLLSRECAAALAPHATTFTHHMLAAMLHTDSDVAIEATTFWMDYLEVGLPRDALLPVLPVLVERLLQHMVFEEHDEEVVAALEAERGVVRDGAADLRPFHGGRDAGGGGDGASGETAAAGAHQLFVFSSCFQAPLMFPSSHTRGSPCRRRRGADGVHAPAQLRAGARLPRRRALRHAAAARAAPRGALPLGRGLAAARSGRPRAWRGG